MTYSETIREILKKRREREQLQEQILLEFPKKVNAIDVNWLEQFSFNSGYFEKIMERKELLSPFKFDKYDGYSFSVGKSINDIIVAENGKGLIAFFQYEKESLNGLDIVDEKKVWQCVFHIGLMRKLILEKYLKEHDAILSDGNHTELGMKYWKQLLKDAENFGYYLYTVKNKDIFKYNSDEFDEYYNRNLFHKFLITKKKID